MKCNERKFIRILALILATAVLFSTGAALAESYTAIVTNGPIQVYANASLTGKSVSLDAYSTVTVSTVKNGIAQLKSGNYTGYTRLDNLTALNSIASTPAVTNQATRIFAQPNVKSKSVAVPKGYSLNVLTSNDNYAVVELNGAVGYAITSHLTTAVSNLSANSTTSAKIAAAAAANGITIETYEAIVIVDGLPVYKSAKTSSKRLGTLPAGTGVTVYAYNNLWAFIGKGGKFGFCALAGLQRGAGQSSTAGSISGSVPVTVTAATMTVYANASTTSKTLGRLPQGMQVNLIRTEGNWAYIELNGHYGYCNILDITNRSSSSTAYQGETINGHAPLGTATVIQSSAPVFSSMKTSASSASLKMGETVSYYGYDATWMLVGRDGNFGFMLRSTLSTDSYAELALEDSGAGVVQLETALLTLGYLDAVPSGIYNSATASAVQRLQAALGMNQTGRADLATLRVLYSGNAPVSPIFSVTLSSGNTGDNVSRLQARLHALGYLSRESSIDGEYGSTTTSAVRLFQTAAGISATGSADAKTIRALYSVNAPTLGSGQVAPDQTSSNSSSGGSSNTEAIPDGLASTTSSYLSTMSNAQKLEYVIYTAQQQLGKPYVFGAAGPSTFDCSGLMLYCFGKIGITLQHSAYGEGYNDKYPKISSKSSLIRGDMVFLNTVSDGDLCDHVGIYLGKGYFLHAGSGAGKVIISTLESGYYSRVFSWGRRVLSA